MAKPPATKPTAAKPRAKKAPASPKQPATRRPTGRNTSRSSRSDGARPSPGRSTKAEPSAANRPSDAGFIAAGLAVIVGLVIATVAVWLLVGLGPGTGALQQPSIRDTIGTVTVGLAVGLVVLGVFLGLDGLDQQTQNHEDVVAMLSMDVLAAVLLFLGLVPFLQVGYVAAWASVIVPVALTPALVAAAQRWPRLTLPVSLANAALVLVLAGLLLGTAQAVVGDTEGFWGILGRWVDDGSFGH